MERTLLAPAQSSARVIPQLFVPSVHSQLLFPAMKEGEFCPSPSHSDLGISSSGMASLSNNQPPLSLPWAVQGASWNSSEYLVAV